VPEPLAIRIQEVPAWPRPPAPKAKDGFRLLSAHAEAVTLVVLAAGAVGGGVLATVRGALTARAAR
jgi:hypothetical protein